MVKTAVMSRAAKRKGKAGGWAAFSCSSLLTNTGAVTLHGVTVADQLVAPAGPALTVTCPAGDLAPGADLTCTASPYRSDERRVGNESGAALAPVPGVPATVRAVVAPAADPP